MTQKQTELRLIRMSEVETQEVRWLWRPYIPFGKITIIQGNPGEGKTTLSLRLAAACSQGQALPGMEPGAPINILYQTAEDGLGDTIKPRLMSAGADLNRIVCINETERSLSLLDNRIERGIRETKVCLKSTQRQEHCRDKAMILVGIAHCSTIAGSGIGNIFQP